MLLERFVCGRTRSNSYVLAPKPDRALVVDAGAGAARCVIDLVEAEGLEPCAVVLTHGHPDHIWTARQLSDRFEVPVYIHRQDVRWFSDPATGGRLPGIRLAGGAVARARRLRPRRLQLVGDDEVIERAGFRLQFLHTPGHSRGSVCIRTEGVCFAGDTVFRGGVGRAMFPGGSPEALRRSISSKLLALPDDVPLFPGHGKDTSVGEERARWEAFVGAGG